MEESKQSSNPFLFTTPNKKPTSTTTTAAVGPAVATPDRVNPNPSTRARNQHMALSIADIRRKAQQLRRPNTIGSGLPMMGPSGFGSDVKKVGSGSQKPTSNLAEKHQILCDFFVAMVNSIRLLRLKGVPPTLTKLACNIESLTDRRFTLHHLAQMKHIVPEVIVAKKIRIHDDKTKCMKEDLLLSMDVDALEISKDVKVGDGFSQLKKIFRTRVVEFSKTLQEDDDIPEGELPHLFHQPKQESESNSNNTSTPLVASLIAPSFKRRFSSKLLGGQVSESTPVQQSTCLSETPTKESASSEDNDGFCSSTLKADEAVLCPASTPAKLASVPQKFASTPSELASTPAQLMTATPALRTPKRTLITSDNDTCELPSKPTKRRSLKFDESSTDTEDELSQVDEEDNILPAYSSVIAMDDVLTVLPENILLSLIKKEKKIIEEKDPIVSQARRRQQMMAGVPKLFDMIRLLFQSIRRTVITKDELIYKLLSGHAGIIDRVEVEEQLQLLQELAPEYISEQISLSGDTLISLNKYSSAESIRAKLLEAS